jgi:Domain of unknown function (DUF4258)
MKNKSLINLVIILFVGLALFLINKNKKPDAKIENFRKAQKSHFGDDTKAPSSFSNDPKDINRHPKKIHYSKHAKCRMGCRNLDESEVVEILEKGEINLRKSNDRPNKCPTYALEGKTHDGQQARMVFSFCGADEVTVVTVIDLDTDWQCSCY